MKRSAYTLVIGLLMIGGSLLASTVDNVSLSYKDGAAVARIDVDGQVRFIHQTEVPKDGRPFRVIVDILGSVHNLTAKEYMNLPPCPVTGIRSSQYSVTPEKIVRLVFDMTRSPLYNIESDPKGVTLTFTDNKTQPFAAWSGLEDQPRVSKKSVEASPKVVSTATAQNRTIEKDRIASLAPTQTMTAEKTDPAQQNQKTKPVTKPTVTKAKTPDTIYQPEFDEADLTLANSEKKVVPTPEKSKMTVTQNKPVVLASQSEPVAKPVSKIDTKTSPASSPASAPNKVEVAPDKAPAKVQQAVTTTKKAVTKAKETKNSEAVPAKKVLASKDQTDKTASGKVDSENSVAASTSRFRRSPAQVKGTMVAEFPKRLVVKYRTHSLRDPFASLVVETASYEGPIEAKVPNVEGMKLVGVIDSDGGSNRALLEDKQGFSFILKSGDKVQSGYVLRVESDRVYFQVFEYGWSRTIALHLEDY